MTWSVARPLAAALLVVAALPARAAATWSLIVLDRRGQLVGVAGASCTPDVYGILRLVPGRGALVAQAVGDDAAIGRAHALLRAGATADSVLRAVTAPGADAGVEERQYAVATLGGGGAQFTGRATAGHHGARGGTDVLVQGNTLPGPEVLDRVLAAVERARVEGLPLEQVLMAGLRAGADAGGDVRCGAQRATSAFLTVARPGDLPHLPWLTLSVFRTPRGGPNAVQVLQARLARWQASGGARDRVTSEGVQPDSAYRPST